MEALRDLWEQFDEQNVALHDTLDLLYAVSEGALCCDLDHRRYANALTVIWDRLTALEVRYADLNEALIAAVRAGEDQVAQ